MRYGANAAWIGAISELGLLRRRPHRRAFAADGIRGWYDGGWRVRRARASLHWQLQPDVDRPACSSRGRTVAWMGRQQASRKGQVTSSKGRPL